MKKPNQKASIYTLTLASSLVLVAVVLGLSYQVLQYRQTSRGNIRIDQASVYAELGIRHALRYTIDDPLWRQHLTNGPWIADIPVGDATYSVTGFDTRDGIFTNNDSDPVELTCTATVGSVNRIVQLHARQLPYEILRYAVVAGGDVFLSNHVRVTGNVTSNDDIDKSGADTWIFGDAEAVDVIHETTNISGTVSPASAPKELPDPTVIFAYYQAATSIPYRSTMERILLSPTNNPYGSTNPDGLYKMVCDNQKVVIKECRIVGTLFLINPKDDSRIEISINWQPARSDYPALIIQGPRFGIITDRNLEEENIGYVDLNLPGESGYGSVFTDFPNEINGLVYSTGKVILDKYSQIKGSLVATGDIELKDYSRCIYDASMYDNPPVKFLKACLYPIPGTWREVLPP